MKFLALVAMGGAAGAMLRYGVCFWAGQLLGKAFPWGTLVVNSVGALLIGLLVAATESGIASRDLRALLIVGLLGAFTTFSTFSLEGLNLLRDRQYIAAGGSILGGCAVGLVMAYVGISLGRVLMGVGAR